MKLHITILKIHKRGQKELFKQISQEMAYLLLCHIQTLFGWSGNIFFSFDFYIWNHHSGQRFKTGNFKLANEPHQRRHSVINSEFLKQLIKEDLRLTLRELAEGIDWCHTTDGNN